MDAIRNGKRYIVAAPDDAPDSDFAAAPESTKPGRWIVTYFGQVKGSG